MSSESPQSSPAIQAVLGDWTPSYSPWRHGGWYVDNVGYPSGAVGCVSRNYADRKWRIVCDERGGDHTYPNRDAAARAEHDITLALCRADLTDAQREVVEAWRETDYRLTSGSARLHNALNRLRRALEAQETRTEWNFYLPDEDRNAGWTNHCYTLQFVCNGFGTGPATAWKEAIAAHRVPDGYDLAEPPTVAIQAEHEHEVDIPQS
ncbi:MAG TPA: hypothetical protein VK701_03840 [Solirubrobacteraceae bacterium]|jgi:hypothetical protein|nr:hypothetical protein [Solirubrobacteraceae bacterium]